MCVCMLEDEMIKNNHILSLTIIIKNKRTNYRIIITEADNTPNNFILYFLTVSIY